MGEAVVTDSAVMMESEKLFWKFCGGVLLSKAWMVKFEVPAVVGRLTSALLQGDELVAEVDEGHLPAATAERQLAEDPLEELECLVDGAHLDGDVVDPDRTGSHSEPA
jgi:hypothetical protein